MNQDGVKLDYSKPPRSWRLKKWLRRLMWTSLVVLVILTMPFTWLWWDWQSELGAIKQFETGDGNVRMMRLQVPVLSQLIPEQCAWLLDRADTVIADENTRDADLIHLQQLKRLRCLYLDNTRITDAGLVHLKGLTSLQMLLFDRTQVTDAGLAHLEGLTELEGLGFANSRGITDKGLIHLKSLRRLRMLSIDNTQVTPAGIDDLRKSLPGCQISLQPQSNR